MAPMDHGISSQVCDEMWWKFLLLQMSPETQRVVYTMNMTPWYCDEYPNISQFVSYDKCIVSYRYKFN